MRPKTFLFFILSLLWLIPLAGTGWNYFRFTKANEQVFALIESGLYEIRKLFRERDYHLKNLDERLQRLERLK